MIDFTYKDLFNNSSVRKVIELKIEGIDEVITNDTIYSESLRLSESICSSSQLTFGGCESSMLEIQIRNLYGDLTGKQIECYMAIGSDTSQLVMLGSYKIDNCELSADKGYIKIKAYDYMSEIIKLNVATWYNGLTFPLTLKAFRDSFFNYIGIEQEETTLIQDDIEITKTIDGDTISGVDVIRAICEINAVFGLIDRDGSFKYVSLDTDTKSEYVTYRECEYEDYRTPTIDSVQIRQEADDVGVIYGSGANTYIIQGNFLVYDKEEAELNTIADRFLSKASLVTYVPYKAKVIGNPCVEIGDYISIIGKTTTVYSFIFNRELSGLQSLVDNISADGSSEYTENASSVTSSYTQIKGKISKLKRDINGLISEVSDLSTETSTRFEQTNELISTKVDKGGVVSEINQSAEEIKIKADKISLEGTITANGTFSINKDGTMSASGGKLGNWKIVDGSLVGYSDVSSAYYRNALYLTPPTSYTSSGVPIIYTMTENTYTGDKSFKFCIESNGNATLGDISLNSIQGNFEDGIFTFNPKYTDTSSSDGGISSELSGVHYNLCSGNDNYNNSITIGSHIYNPGTGLGMESMNLYAYNICALAPVGGGAFYPSLSSAQSLGRSTNLWSTVYARNTTISTSDRRLKKDIEPIADKYIELFNDLQPCTFKYIDRGDEARTHIGFISQDVEENMAKHGISALEFAGFCKDENGKEEDGSPHYDYALRYAEFIALNTAMIKRQQTEIESLKSEIEALKKHLNL